LGFCFILKIFIEAGVMYRVDVKVSRGTRGKFRDSVGSLVHGAGLVEFRGFIGGFGNGDGLTSPVDGRVGFSEPGHS
jgi:hypothetical protein